MFLSIIIVNYKSPQLTIRCISSIKRTVSKNTEYEIIVVDNNSEDNSENIVKQNFADIQWINNKKNEGFGRANNIGASISKGKYLLLLNSDMILQENTIEACLNEIEKKPEIGVLGCKLVNEDGSFQKSYFTVARFRDLLDRNIVFNYFIKESEKKIEALMGSFMMFPKYVFNEVGGFDPDFFMYSEELELCHRISKNGYKICYFDKVSAIHKHGGSISDKSWGYKQRYLSNALLYYKVRGLFGYLLYHKLFLLNTFTNFFSMWFLDKNYRRDFWQQQKAYFSNFGYYFLIPFLYKRKSGCGERILKA